MYLENGNSTNFAFGMKNGEMCHCVESICPHEQQGLHPSIKGEIFLQGS
jgi:hypothetical protein